MNKFLLVCVLVALCGCVYGKTGWFELDTYTFQDYVVEYNKIYTPIEYKIRSAIFDANLRSIKSHNAGDFSFKKGVNHFTDQTDQELRSMFGYKKGVVSTLDQSYILPHELSTDKGAPAAVDWREKDVISPVKDQGRCGSCWAFATAAGVESSCALATGKVTILSEQQILDCTPNPDFCGGSGGCGGGTIDIAVAKIIEKGGLASEWTYPYVSYFGQDFPKCNFDASRTVPVAKLKGLAKLPVNKYEPVLNYLGSHGPLVINVDAGGWHNYESGVYSACSNTSTGINHVVQLVGYGTDSKHGDYWLVRNSWTPSWGEDGYIRIARTSQEECGIDKKPLDGTGCKGGPEQVVVCGPCGLLYDTSYPVVDTASF